MAVLKRTEEESRILKIHLNGKLSMDSNKVDYNLRGTVIYRDYVEHIEHVREDDTHILTLPSDTHVSPEVIVAQNTGHECVKLFKVRTTRGGHSYEFTLLPTEYIEKIEQTESRKVTHVP